MNLHKNLNLTLYPNLNPGFIKKIKNMIMIKKTALSQYLYSYFKFFYIIFFLSIILTGCSGTTSEKPPKIVLGQDPCDNCFMIINEFKYAASVRLENGDAKRFDDIGCMIDFQNKNKTKANAYWVYDYLTKKPIHAEAAYFIDSDSLITPMGFGIAAFKSKTGAEKYAEKYKTKITSFKELKNKYHKLKTE